MNGESASPNCTCTISTDHLFNAQQRLTPLVTGAAVLLSAHPILAQTAGSSPLLPFLVTRQEVSFPLSLACCIRFRQIQCGGQELCYFATRPPEGAAVARLSGRGITLRAPPAAWRLGIRLFGRGVPCVERQPGTVRSMHHRTGRRLVYGSAPVVVGLGLAQAFTAAQLALAARSSALAPFGAFISLYSVTVTVGALINFGAQVGLTRELSKGRPPCYQTSAFYSRAIASAAATVPFSALMLALNAGKLPVTCVVLLSSQAGTVPIALDVMGAARGLRPPWMSVWCATVGNFSGLLVYVVFFGARGLTGAAVGLAITWVVSIGVGAVIARSFWIKIAPARLTKAWTGMSSFGVATVADAASQVAVPIVDWSAGPAAAGLAGAVSRWTAPVQLLTNAHATQLFPELAAADSEMDAMNILKAAWLVPIVSIFLSLGLLVAAPMVVNLTLGPQYVGGGRILQLLALASALSAVGRHAVIFLQARGEEKFVAQVSVTIRAASVIVLWLLARSFGGIAIGWTAVVTSGAFAAIGWIRIRSKSPRHAN